jgi:lipopolysaccharide transport system ATP-binding protein
VSAVLALGAGFNPEFTGRQNVYVNASILGLGRDEIDARFADIAAFADIGDFIDQPMKTYSSGMYMRLAFAVMAHVGSDVLVIDEALAVGDVFFVQKCMRFLRNFRERGTVVFVSHDTGAVVNLCQRAMWLDRGRVQMIGAPKEVAEAYLTAMCEAQQGASAVSGTRLRPGAEREKRVPPKDMRRNFINASPLRNDVEVFAFHDDGPSFGKGGARVVSVVLTEESGAPLKWLVGGEDVRLVIRCVAETDLHSVIVGFYIKDRLGQWLFGDNTYLTYRFSPVAVRAGQELEAGFSFQMPILPVGDYSVCVAIAEGSQQEHVQHHWIHDALIIRSHSSSVVTGLVGVPMTAIDLALVGSEPTERSCL